MCVVVQVRWCHCVFAFLRVKPFIHSCLRKRAIIARLLHNSTELCIDGLLSPEKIIKADPPIKEVLNVGATYTWVPREVLKKYPGLAEIAQASGNYLQNASKAEHDGQLMMKVGSKIATEVPFDEIKNIVKKNRSKNLESLPGMYHFLRKFGGGKSMHLAKQSSNFIRGEANTSRRVEPALWEALGLDFRGSNQMVRLRHGALCILYTDPNVKIVSVGDIKSLGGRDKLVKAIEAEDVVAGLAVAIQNAPIKQSPVLASEFVKFQATVFAWMVGKRSAAMITRITSQFDIDFDKLELGHLQWHFAHCVTDRCQLQMPMGDFDAFKLNPKPVDTAEKDFKEGSSVRDATQDMTAAIMADLGWHLKDVVEHKTEKGRASELSEFSNGFVKLTCVADGKTQRVRLQDFQDKQWKANKTVIAISVPLDAPRPPDSDEYNLNLVKSLAFLALREASGQQEGIDLVKVTTKPSKSVEALSNIPKGKLQMAPETMKLSFTEKAKCSVGCDAYSNSSMLLGSVSVNGTQYNMFAAGIASAIPCDKKAGMQAPFWSLETVSKESEANVALTHKVANLQIKHSMLDAWLGNECTTSDCMKVPMIVSSKALNAGDKLKMFVPSKRQKTGPAN